MCEFINNRAQNQIYIFPHSLRSSKMSLSFSSRSARGDCVSRPPAWMMRQAGRYMASYRKLVEKHPSFRERSEIIDLIVEIFLQPWEDFHSDGVCQVCRKKGHILNLGHGVLVGTPEEAVAHFPMLREA